LAAVQKLVRVIRETLNTPNAEGGMSPGHGRFVPPVLPEDNGEVLAIPLGSLLDSPGLDQVDLTRSERPGPHVRVAVALRDVRATLAAYQGASHLQDLWGELLAHRLFDVKFDSHPGWRFGAATSHLRAVFRPVGESLLGDLLEAARAADPAAPPSDPIEVRTPTPPEPAKQRYKGKRINERMLEMLQDDSSRVNWTARQWADHLGCSVSTVQGTRTWENILTTRKLQAVDATNREEAGRRTDRRRFGKKKRSDGG
jgi:hypothetical protein